MPPTVPSPPTVPPLAPAGAGRDADVPALAAAWLDARDDVATAMRDLPAGHRALVAADGAEREVLVRETIPLGHKFAVHGIAAGRRVRKYGEYIGRTTAGVAAGAWVHLHNLATTATRRGDDEQAWRMQAPPAGGVRVLPGATCSEGASPAYDARAGRLYWLDVAAPVLHALDVARNTARAIALPRPAHVVVVLDDGTLALATASDFLACDPATGACTLLAPAPPRTAGERWTGAACTADGRVWMTAANLAHADRPGTLTSRLAAPPMASPLAVPTGLAAAGEGRTLLVVDAARAGVERWDLDHAGGDTAAMRTLADAGALPGDLWGAALDADGGLWCALRDAGCVLRFARDGALTHAVRLPAAKPTGCTFAGPALHELVVTTAGGGSDEAAGHTLALDVGMAGVAPRQATRAAFGALAAS